MSVFNFILYEITVPIGKLMERDALALMHHVADVVSVPAMMLALLLLLYGPASTSQVVVFLLEQKDMFSFFQFSN